MKSLTIGMAVLAATFMSSFAYANTAQDNVVSIGSPKVLSTHGNCVRTKWHTANDACAPAPVAQQVAPRPAPVARLMRDQRTIYFDFNKSDLTPEAITKLNALAYAVQQSPDVRSAIILGYTDEIGSSAQNDKLSRARAAAVNNYLAQYIAVPTSVLMVDGKGEINSVTNCPKSMKRKARIACLAKDRRVEIEFDYIRYHTPFADR